jgi:hypothetical protein
LAVCSSDAAAPATVNEDAEQTITAGQVPSLEEQLGINDIGSGAIRPIANDAPGLMKPAETTAVAAVSLSIHP